jgi:DDE superfamily endonuclease
VLLSQRSLASPYGYDTEYKRHGTANIFIAFEPLTGQRQTKVTVQRTKVDWAHFIKELVDQHYPHVEKIRLVMDNLNTHTKASLYEAFDPPEAKRIADKLEVHYTPKHGSWFNVSDHRGSNSQTIDFESIKIYPIFTVKIENPGKSNT